MPVKTLTLPVEKAAIIQQKHAEFGCALVEIGISSANTARITLSGPEEEMDKLLKLVD